MKKGLLEKSCHGGTYNHSNPDMRKAWVATMSEAMSTGLIDGFFIDVTPQVMPNHTETGDPVDPMIPSALAMNGMCQHCTDERRAELLNGLTLALAELAAACPKAIIICNPSDWGACNTHFFEYFGSSADHGRSVLGDFYILQNKYKETGHIVQARAATQNKSTVFHIAEFLISAGPYTYLGASHGWGCDDGWFELGVPGDPHIWERPLGKPLGAMHRVPNGAPPMPSKHGKEMTGGWVYTRSFDKGTHVWLNLTDGAKWKHARSCERPNHAWPDPMVLGCPQVCIWWGDGNVTSWPQGFVCNKTATIGPSVTRVVSGA
jgi:hypothetical protein